MSDTSCCCYYLWRDGDCGNLYMTWHLARYVKSTKLFDPPECRLSYPALWWKDLLFSPLHCSR